MMMMMVVMMMMMGWQLPLDKEWCAKCCPLSLAFACL